MIYPRPLQFVPNTRDNAYYIPNSRLRAFYAKHILYRIQRFVVGGLQGMIGIERIMDQIAMRLGRDPVEIRKINYYPDCAAGNFQRKPYGQIVKDGILNTLTDQLVVRANYLDRRKEIDLYNKSSPIKRRGLGFMPVKFGISFNRTMLNQAGALVHV